MQAALRNLVKRDRRSRDMFDRARASRHRQTTVYDVASTCNLFCEGCLFFNRDGDHPGTPSHFTLDRQMRLFRAEVARGVTYPVFGGAEPALNQDALRLAAEVWGTGMVHTNGTIRIDPDLPFRLFISLWGGRDLTRKWRGADCYHKALRTAAGDPRVIMNYTVNRQNIDDIPGIVADCADLGLPITFQGFSPTVDYSDYIAQGAAGDHTYIQGNTPEDNLVLSAADRHRAAAVISDCIDRFPETVVFTKALAAWVFTNPGLFPDATENGHAPAGCIAAQDPGHRHHLFGGGEETRKGCGHGDIDCRTCKTYTTIYPSYFRQMLSQPMTDGMARDFLAAHAVFDFLYHGHEAETAWAAHQLSRAA